jgi:competence protein ComEA
MRIKLFSQTPPALTVLAVLAFLCVLLNREASIKEGLPVFLPMEQSFVSVELMGEGLASGVYQINDGLTLSSVMELTGVSQVESLSDDSVWLQPLQGGESFRIVKKDQEIEVIQRGWMPASHRVAMAIPLHPDRMNVNDWAFLPGIGVALAERIEKDRQKNGDFGSLDALIRVKGIGKKRISNWNMFF